MKTLHKIILLTIGLFAINYAAQAQIGVYNPYKFEFSGGVNLSEMEVRGSKVDGEFKIGFNFYGAFTYNLYQEFGVKTGVMLTKKGLKHKVDNYTEDELTGKITHLNAKTTIDANYAQVPLMLGYEFKADRRIAITLFGGGYGAYGFTGETKMKGFEETLYGAIVGDSRDIDSKEDTFDKTLKKFDYGIMASAGIVLDDMYTLNFSYEYGLANLSKNTQIYNSLKNRTYMLSFGFRF